MIYKITDMVQKQTAVFLLWQYKRRLMTVLKTAEERLLCRRVTM